MDNHQRAQVSLCSGLQAHFSHTKHQKSETGNQPSLHAFNLSFKKNMLFTFEPEETQILVSFNDQAIIGELRECWGDAPSIQVVLLIS